MSIVVSRSLRRRALLSLLLTAAPVCAFSTLSSRPFASVPSSFLSKRSMTSDSISDSTTVEPTAGADEFTYLEDVESEASLAFAMESNAKCLADLGDPTTSETYDRILAVLESDDRIPYAGKMGKNMDGADIVFNFWKDSNNPKGLWRQTTLESYKTAKPDWTTVLDIDKLAKEDGISWVYKGSRALPRRRDTESPNDGTVVTRALLNLSRGGSDAKYVKEFDLLTGDFVKDEPFNLPEAKSSVSYKSRNVLLVGTDMGEGSMTDSGYPRQIREWYRGTDIKDAPVVFEGDKKDVSVGSYIDDNRHYGGPIYEVRYRGLTFYTSKYWVRAIKFDHLLAPSERREGVAEPGDFIEVAVQDDAKVNFLGNMMLVTLRSDWEVAGKTYKLGSVIYCDAKTFLDTGTADFTMLFEPTDNTALEYYSATRNYVCLVTMNDVKSKLDFYKIGDNGSSLTYVGGDKEAQVRSASVSALDTTDSDEFWFTTSGYTQPSTLCLADASRVEDGKDYIIEEVKSLPAQYDSSALDVEQHFATSKDGTQVPYFVVKKKGTELNGKTPTLLYGYGGFEISLGPSYSATVGIAWLEKGGAFVEACIRGGGEYGPSWHQAALKEKRNKAYEDFIAVGEDLCSKGLCTAGSTLAARGGSNGGLLMGNMYLQGKDLFGAIHCAVPLLDMQRFHTLLAGASWMAEYGDPETDDWDNFLNKYSPYHNIDETVEKYPAMLVTTSTRDDRVHPAHARKMVAKLWDMGKGKNWPVHYYENIEGGHGGAADAKQSAFMSTLAYDFMMKTLKKNAEEL
mmetsp:Transcript_29158/g.48195  ORF Transcript_29158/g.48195 Transcript_29158/m.48195 type:complete len:794 (-) Transcript_29158:41-2422(-)